MARTVSLTSTDRRIRCAGRRVAVLEAMDNEYRTAEAEKIRQQVDSAIDRANERGSHERAKEIAALFCEGLYG